MEARQLATTPCMKPNMLNMSTLVYASTFTGAPVPRSP
jgi:hypothetical protein